MSVITIETFENYRRQFNKTSLLIVESVSGSRHRVKKFRYLDAKNQQAVEYSDGVLITQPFVSQFIECKNIVEMQKKLIGEIK